jgi:large subunit ribosomal protein L22
LYVKRAQVDPGSIIYRFLPAPQGRAYRVRKRRNHVTLIVENRVKLEEE